VVGIDSAMSTVHERLPGELRTDRPLPSYLVHKTAIEQVFVTDWMPGPGADLCTIAARLPLAHARFSDTAAPYHDILLVAEAARQAGLLVAAQVVKVDSERQFLLRELIVELSPVANARRRQDGCDMLISQDTSQSKVMSRPGRAIAGGVMHARFTIGGRHAGVCRVIGAWVPNSFYEGLRRRRETPRDPRPGDPPAVDLRERRTGKCTASNAVITALRKSDAQRAYEASLIVDVEDPTFFDHPLDHVPGLCLLAGVQQVAVAGACEVLGVDHSCIVVSAIQMKFSQIAEFHPEVICSVALDEDCRSAIVSCVQGAKVCCSGTVRLSHV
jgi:2-oxo-3-(phosphooxy)propyl 3-oxoalkanoate synthase